MILVDTSAWVEFDRSTGSPVDRRLTALITEEAPVAVTGPIIMEVLAGARDAKREHELRRLMQRFTLLRFDPVVDFEAAARIYRTCRQAGVTPRGMIDCMIASVAHRHGASMLTADADLNRVSAVMKIAIEPTP